MSHTPAHDAVPEIALNWFREGKGAALATVIETWGSSPRPVGSQLAISGEGEIMGSVSGGCVEGAVVAEALELIGTAECRILTYGVSDENAFAVGLACGGTIRVMVEPVGSGGIDPELLSELVAARSARQALAVETNLTDWMRKLVRPPEHAARFRSDKSGTEEEVFVAIHNPPLRMAVIGAVHIAQPLLQIARVTGYDCTLIDPRDSFGSTARFPGETILSDWPDDALASFAPDARTAIVTLTHDAKLDDPAIRFALNSDCFYLGCLGSTRTHAKRLDRLREAGFTEAQLARIHAPVGLDIGSSSPAEIAVSIMAEITQVLRQR